MLAIAIKGQAQIDDDLLSKQINLESLGNHYKVDGTLTESPKGALGIAQFMPDTWQWLKDSNRIPSNYTITNELHQRKAQKIFMQYLYSRDYGIVDDKTELALASYNAGPGRVQYLIDTYGSLWRDYLPKETKDYLNKIKL